ncbi:penicillin-binding protein, partial [Streptomyces sp. TRM76130]|nr:penicillin-binding protein [Streptomyces sp. TRM76130]
GPPSGDEVAATTEKFFAAWEDGNAEEAASYTNDAASATTLLTAYAEDAHIGGVTITPGTATGTEVPFTVQAEVSYQGKTEPLTYESRLSVVRGKTTGRALVDWEPSVVHPELSAEGDTLVTAEASAPPIEAVDRDGKVLTKEEYPSLGPVLDTLRERYGDQAGGEPGVELMVRHASPEVADTPLVSLTEGEPGKLETTLSASVQAAAEKAVEEFDESSVVAVKPSTGEVLAVANHRADGFNAAFQGRVAPGSTM